MTNLDGLVAALVAAREKREKLEVALVAAWEAGRRSLEDAQESQGAIRVALAAAKEVESAAKIKALTAAKEEDMSR